jgi:hypothetical protein
VYIVLHSLATKKVDKFSKNQMKKNQINKKVSIGLILILILLASCNSVKRVLEDPKKFKRVANVAVKLGYCVNDTVINTVLQDTIIYRDSIVTDSVITPCPDFSKTFPSGITVNSKNGILTIQGNLKIPEKRTVKVVTNNIRDKKLESILTAERDTALNNLYISNKINQELKEELKQSQKEVKKQKTKFILVLSGLGLVVLLGAYFKLKKFIPFI